MSKIIQYITGTTLGMGLVLSGGAAMAHSHCAKEHRCESRCESRCDFRRDFRRDFRGDCGVGVAARPSVLVVVNSGINSGLNRGFIGDRCGSSCDTGRTGAVVVAVDGNRGLVGDRLGLGIGSRIGDGFWDRRFDRGLFRFGRRGW